MNKALLIAALAATTISCHAADSEIIVESYQDGYNADAFKKADGKWSESAAKSKAPGLHATKSVFNDADSVAGAARFTPNVPVAGHYEVFATYPESGNASGVTYKVVSADGEKTLTFDQNGRDPSANPPSNKWFSLGTFNFAAGTAGYVEVSDPLTGKRPFEKEPLARIYADAIKLVPKDVKLPADYANKLGGASGGAATTVASAAAPAAPASGGSEPAPAGAGLPPLPPGAPPASAAPGLPTLPSSTASAPAASGSLPSLPPSTGASASLPSIPGGAAASSSLPSLPSAAGTPAAGSLPNLPSSAGASAGLPSLPGGASTAGAASGLPSLPSAGSASASAGLPSLPAGAASAGAATSLPSLPSAGPSASTSLPALPAASGSSAPALPSLPSAGASASAGAPPALPGLPTAASSTASTAPPALPGLPPASTGAAGAPPALPGGSSLPPPLATPAAANVAALTGTPAVGAPPPPAPGAPGLPGAPAGLPGGPAGAPPMPGGAPAGGNAMVTADNPSGLPWGFDFGAALNQARPQNKKVLVFFSAKGNHQAIAYETDYFKNPAVRSILDQYVLVKVDFPQNTRLGYTLDIYGAGQIAVTDATGTPIGRVETSTSADDLAKQLSAIK